MKIEKLVQEGGFLSQVPKTKPMEHIGLTHFFLYTHRFCGYDSVSTADLTRSIVHEV